MIFLSSWSSSFDSIPFPSRSSLSHLTNLNQRSFTPLSPLQPFFFVPRKGSLESLPRPRPLPLFILAGPLSLSSRLDRRCRSRVGVVQVLHVLGEKERVLEGDPGALGKDGVELAEPKRKKTNKEEEEEEEEEAKEGGVEKQRYRTARHAGKRKVVLTHDANFARRHQPRLYAATATVPRSSRRARLGLAFGWPAPLLPPSLSVLVREVCCTLSEPVMLCGAREGRGGKLYSAVHMLPAPPPPPFMPVCLLYCLRVRRGRKLF